MTIKKYICQSYIFRLYIIDMNSRHSVYYGRQRDVRVHPEEVVMFKAEEYNWATEWKNTIYRWLDEGCTPWEIAEALDWMHRESPLRRITFIAMGYTVLACTVVSEDGQFWIPSTKEVLYNYRNIKRRLSKGKRIYIEVLDTWNETYYKERIA